MEGILRKDFEFYNFLKSFDADIMFLSETWCCDKCDLIETYLPDFKYVHVPATKSNQKGRAKGGIVFAHKNNVTNIETTANSIVCDIKTNYGTIFSVHTS